MRKNPRRRVVGWEKYRPYPTWPEANRAVLECGHKVGVGFSSLRPRWKACPECYTLLSGRSSSPWVATFTQPVYQDHDRQGERRYETWLESLKDHGL